MPTSPLPYIVLPFLLFLSGCATSAAPTPTPTPSPTPKAEAQTTAKLQPPLPRSYAALGASETYGVGATPHTDGYAYVVARALHAHPYVNVGIPGTTIDAGYQVELTNALTVRPSLCTVFFGVNDLRAGVPREAFLADLTDLVSTLRRGGCQVLIIGMPDLSHLPAVAHAGLPDLRGVVSSWNSGMLGVAHKTGAHFLDLRDYTAELASHPQYVSPDGLHPSTAGHQRLAQVVLATIHQDRLWK